MRTTLNIDDDVLGEARRLAELEGKSLGKLISELTLTALAREGFFRKRNGLPVLPPRPGKVVTLEMVNELRDELDR